MQLFYFYGIGYLEIIISTDLSMLLGALHLLLRILPRTDGFCMLLPCKDRRK